MGDSSKISIHIDEAKKRDDLPDLGASRLKCCDNPDITMGFGLAGGGFGPYEYCQNCGKIVAKDDDPDVELIDRE